MNSSLKNVLEELLCCAICLESLTEPKLLPCSHRFCKDCLVKEINRAATPLPNPSFPCPLCKRRVYLKNGKNGKEWIEGFETDRLLKDIQSRLYEEQKDEIGMCVPHSMKLGVVCYNCRTSGCYICAWEKHRRCSNVGNFEKEVSRIESDLKYHLTETEQCTKVIVAYVQRWTAVIKSRKNQLKYCNKFIQQCLHEQQRHFETSIEELIHSYDLYIQTTAMTEELELYIRNIMKTFHSKISHGVSVNRMQNHLQSENHKVLSKYISDASSRVKSAPSTKDLVLLTVAIRKILNVPLQDMVIEGDELLSSNVDVMSRKYREDLLHQVKDSNVSLLETKFITNEDQVHLGNDLGLELLNNLKTALQTSNDPLELLQTIHRLCCPGEPNPMEVANISRSRKAARTSKRSKRRRNIAHPAPIQHYVRSEFNRCKPVPIAVIFRGRIIPKPNGIIPIASISFDSDYDMMRCIEAEIIIWTNIGNGNLLEERMEMIYTEQCLEKKIKEMENGPWNKFTPPEKRIKEVAKKPRYTFADLAFTILALCILFLFLFM